MTSNFTIRRVAKEAGVYFWQIAEALNIADSTFTRKLRRELPADETRRILEIIDRLKERDAR